MSPEALKQILHKLAACGKIVVIRVTEGLKRTNKYSDLQQYNTLEQSLFVPNKGLELVHKLVVSPLTQK